MAPVWCPECQLEHGWAEYDVWCDTCQQGHHGGCPRGQSLTPPEHLTGYWVTHGCQLHPDERCRLQVNVRGREGWWVATTEWDAEQHLRPGLLDVACGELAREALAASEHVVLDVTVDGTQLDVTVTSQAPA